MHLFKLGRGSTKEAKLKISANSVQAYPVIVTDNNTDKFIFLDLEENLLNLLINILLT
jgi:hypothetical protein